MKKAMVILGLLLVLGSLTFAESKAMTKEQKNILETVQLLEENPLRNNARELRAKVLKFAIDSKDVEINIDSKFSKIHKLDYTYRDELAFQFIAGCVKFDLLHPDQAFDEKADIVSGVESIVIAYMNIIKEKPNETNPFLDGLVSLKENNQLTLENILQQFKD